MIDFIGDIHGHADELEALLMKLGYVKTNGVYAHAESKVLFVGDYIDRGPKIRETLAIVKAMVDSNHAIALMGNHEYNALCFHLKDETDEYLRPHTEKNIQQNKETIQQFKNWQNEYEEYLAWFKTLPLYYETNDFRAVHACWNNEHIEFLKKTLANDRLTDELIGESVKEGTALHKAIEETLKGKEIKLSDGHFFMDKDGHKRTDIRIKWWENPIAMTYRTISVESFEHLPDQPIETSALASINYYHPKEKKVFFGHYWLKGEPTLFRENICCVDYSVAKAGKLVAYRFGWEDELNTSNLFFV